MNHFLVGDPYKSSFATVTGFRRVLVVDSPLGLETWFRTSKQKPSRGVAKNDIMMKTQVENLSHIIHVWYIYLHLPDFTIKNNQM